MKRLIALVAALCMTVPCFAQTPDAAKTAKVEELMSVMHVDKLMNQMTTMMKAQIGQAAQSDGAMSTMTPAQKKICTDFQNNSIDLIMQSVSWKAIQPDMVKLYMDNFTDQQIDDILVFYKSPTGQAFINKEPMLMQQSMKIAQGRIAIMMPKLKELMEQYKKDMAAATPKAIKLGNPPADKGSN